MSLKQLARDTLRQILNDQNAAFGAEFVLTAPDGFTSALPLVGRTQDIAQMIDPQSGVAVQGRIATVALSLADLTAGGYADMPRGIPETNAKPWLVAFEGNTYRVTDSNPDRSLGVLVLHLEFYRVLA